MACRVSVEKSGDKLIGVLLYIICHFTLAAFNILCLWFSSFWLPCVLVCSSLGLYCCGLSVLPGSSWLFSFPYWGSFQLFSSVQSLRRVQLFVTPWTAARQTSLSITNSRSLLKPCSSSWYCHPTISSSVIPLSSCSPFSQHQGLFQWVSSSYHVVKVLELQHQSFQWIFSTDFL